VLWRPVLLSKRLNISFVCNPMTDSNGTAVALPSTASRFAAARSGCRLLLKSGAMMRTETLCRPTDGASSNSVAVAARGRSAALFRISLSFPPHHTRMQSRGPHRSPGFSPKSRRVEGLFQGEKAQLWVKTLAALVRLPKTAITPRVDLRAARSSDLGDFNGDHLLDLIVSTSGGIAVHLGNGDGTF
jgi:hypothetical protein